MLDDPAAELDGAGLGRLLERVAGMSVQRLITGLDAGRFRPAKDAARFQIERGEVHETGIMVGYAQGQRKRDLQHGRRQDLRLQRY